MSRSTKRLSSVKIFKVKAGKVNVKRLPLKRTNFERKPSGSYGIAIIDSNELKKILGGRISGKNLLKMYSKKLNLPKYLYSFISKANDISGATKAKRIGHLHVYYNQRKFRSLNEWKNWYNKKHPKAIKEAIDTIYNVMKEGMGVTPRKNLKKYIRMFVEDLVYTKTFTGLKIQEAILKKMAEIKDKKYVWSTAKEDASGVDGYIGNIPISIKPETSDMKKKAGTKRMDYKVNEKKLTLSFTFTL